MGLLLSRKREYKLRVVAGSGDDALVCLEWDTGADRVGVVGVAKTPESFDLFGREVEDFLDVEVGTERLDATGLGGLGYWVCRLRLR